MKLRYLSLFILLFSFVPAVHADPIDGVVWLIKSNNMTRLSQLFESTIEVTLNNQEDTYSRAQATSILTKFFDEHKPIKVTLLHKVNTNQKFLFGVAILNSANGNYRIAYTFNEIGGSMKIIEMRIETEKTK
jgi:hypothetical protein